MGLLSALKSILGLGTDEAGPRRGSGDVTVEREADAGSERAVKRGTPDGDAADGAGENEEPVASDSGAADDAAASTDSLVDEAEPQPESAGDSNDGDESTDADAGDSDEATTDGDAGETADDERDVQTVKGIGPAYADRLADAGVHTVSDLLAADPGTVAAETSVGAGRVETWQARADDED
ncbi:MAG: helix-hairpin-helix domain-containing protein [Halolamina sp.]